MTFWSRGYSLQYKIIAAIVMVGLLPLLLLLALTYFEEQRALREIIGANFKEVAVETARRIETEITRGINEAQQLATTPFLRTALVEANRSYEGKNPDVIRGIIGGLQQQWRTRNKRSEFPFFINQIVTNYLIRWHDIRKSDYVGILVTDKQGALVVSSIPQVEYFYGNTPWWNTVVKDGSLNSYVSEIVFDPTYGTHVIVVAAPIFDDISKVVIGAVTILLRRDMIFQNIAEMTIGKSGHAMLLNSDGMAMICPVLPPEAHTVEPEMVQTLDGAKAGWSVVTDDLHGSQNILIGFAPVRFSVGLARGSLGGKQWLTLVRQDPHETYAPLSVLVVKMVSYGIFVLLALWGTGVLVARWLTRPILLLQERVREIGSGRLAQRLDLKTGDEVESLANAFNEMAENLQQSFKLIEQRILDVESLKELEHKVEERTREIDETKKYLEGLLENANDVIYTLDTEQRFTYVNSKIEAWGYRKEDLLGRPYLVLLSKRHRGKRLKVTLDIGAKQVYEVEVLTQTGALRAVMVSVSPLHSVKGEILGVLGIARDMTETKKLEQKIISSERLASVGRLAAGVAHEINNPLGGILNCLYNLGKGTLSVDRQEEYRLSMEDGVRRVQKIVRQLLDFSQQHEPEFGATDIRQIVNQVLKLTTHLFAPNKIILQMVVNYELPTIIVDRHMIEQVVMNLVLNAVQAMKNGGVLTIKVSIIEDVCVLEISDTGVGISPTILPRIFDPFFSTKSEGEGTGLGLSVSLGIMERHGGKILVKSEVGKGTTFTLQIPISRERLLLERIP